LQQPLVTSDVGKHPSLSKADGGGAGAGQPVPVVRMLTRGSKHPGGNWRGGGSGLGGAETSATGRGVELETGGGSALEPDADTGGSGGVTRGDSSFASTTGGGAGRG
jgi:hypothetical protein